MTATILPFVRPEPKQPPAPEQPKLHLANEVRYPCGAADCSACGEEHIHDYVTDAMDWALSANPCKAIPIIGGEK